MVKFDKLLCTPSAVLRCYLLSRFPEIDISGNEKGNLVRLQPWIVNGAKKKQIYEGILFSQLTKHIYCYSMPFCLHVLSLSDSLSVPLFKAGPENLFYAEVFFHRWARMHIPLPSIGLHSSQFFSNHRQERIRSIFIFHHLITTTPCFLRDTDRFVLSRVLRRTRQQICNL